MKTFVNRFTVAILGSLMATGCTQLLEDQLDKQVAKEMSKIEKQVADDAVAQYNIAKSGGDKMDICVQAGLVSASFLQAKDQSNYKKWKDIEKRDCKAAGMPSF